MHLLRVRISLFSYDMESANTTKILRKMNNRTLSQSVQHAGALHIWKSVWNRVSYNSFADLSILVIRKHSESMEELKGIIVEE